MVERGLEHHSAPEIIELDPVPLEMVPHGACFVVVLRVDRAGAPVHPQAPGSSGCRIVRSVPPVVRGGVRLDPFIGICIDKPSVPVCGNIGIDVEVVSNGKLPGKLQVVCHDCGALHFHRSGAVCETNPFAVPRQRRIALRLPYLAEYLVERPVFLRYEDDMLDRRLPLAAVQRNGILRAECICRRRILDREVVSDHFLCQRRELAVRRDFDDRHRPFHDAADVCPLRPRDEVLPAVRSASIAFCVGHDEPFPVFRHLKLGGEPAGRDVPQDCERRDVDHSDGVDPRFRHIEPLLVGGDRKPEWNDASQTSHCLVERQGDMTQDAVVQNVDDGDIVIVPVACEDVCGSRRERIWA